MTAVRLAVLGDPIDHSRSPDLHRAGLASVGLQGESRAIRTPAGTLGERLRQLAGEGVIGVNLTHPLKEEALAHLARVSDAARLARSVNTVGFGPGGAWGDTTDGAGAIDWLAELERPAAKQRVVLLGGGGAARSIGAALSGAGAKVTISVRRPAGAALIAATVREADCVGWRSAEEAVALGAATVVIHATPLTAPDQVAPLEAIAKRALVLDLVYGAEVTPWIAAARASGRKAYDGLGLLVHQARHSMERWFQRPVPVEPLAKAVGWPR